MILTVHIFDLLKAQELIDDNEFLRKVLVWRDGAWLIDTEDPAQIKEIKRLFDARRIRYNIKNE